MKNKYMICAAMILNGLAASAQNVGINVTGATPHNSSILDLNTGNTFTSPNGKGMLIPNVALTGTGDATTVASPATSLMVYNTATAGSGATAVTPGYYYWDGTKWVQFQSSSNASQDWKLTGNSGTTAGTNFIGTTDAVDFVTKTNNAERMRVTSTGNVGIGTTTPATKLTVNTGTVNGAIQIVDGTQGASKVLVSDANGVGIWRPVLGGVNVSYSSQPGGTWWSPGGGNNTWNFTGITFTITLPGTYLLAQSYQVYNSSGLGYMTTGVMDASSSIVPNSIAQIGVTGYYDTNLSKTSIITLSPGIYTIAAISSTPGTYIAVDPVFRNQVNVSVLFLR